MRSPLLLLSVVAALGCTPAPPHSPASTPARAETPAVAHPPAEVRKASALVRKAAPHGKAHVTELAAGQQAWLGILELAPGVSVPEHRDPTEETIHVLSGGGTITLDGTPHAVGPGDTIFMPANARVSYENGPAPLRAVQVFAGPGPASKYDTWKAQE